MSMSIPVSGVAGPVMVTKSGPKIDVGAHLVEDVGEGDVALEGALAEAGDGDGRAGDEGGGGEEVGGVGGVGLDGVGACGAVGGGGDRDRRVTEVPRLVGEFPGRTVDSRTAPSCGGSCERRARW